MHTRIYHLSAGKNEQLTDRNLDEFLDNHADWREVSPRGLHTVRFYLYNIALMTKVWRNNTCLELHSGYQVFEEQSGCGLATFLQWWKYYLTASMSPWVW